MNNKYYVMTMYSHTYEPISSIYKACVNIFYMLIFNVNSKIFSAAYPSLYPESREG